MQRNATNPFTAKCIFFAHRDSSMARSSAAFAISSAQSNLPVGRVQKVHLEASPAGGKGKLIARRGQEKPIIEILYRLLLGRTYCPQRRRPVSLAYTLACLANQRIGNHVEPPTHSHQCSTNERRKNGSYRYHCTQRG